MEPEIKFENCEEYFNTGISNTNTATPEIFQQNSNDAALKRSYQECSDNFSDPLQQPFQTTEAPQVTPIKRLRNGDAAILFGPPFFELQQNYDKANAHVNRIARCRSCLVVLRGHKNASSNFIKHMKRVHPEVYKIYENAKMKKYCDKSTHFKSVSQAKATMLPHLNLVELPDDDNTFFNGGKYLQNLTATPQKETEEHTAETRSDVISQNNTETCENSMESQPTLDTLTECNELAKVDLSSRTIETMSRMLDEKLCEFVTKSEFVTKAELNSTMQQQRCTTTNYQHNVTEVKTNDADLSPLSPTDALRSQLNALQSECQTLRQCVQQTQQSNWQLKRELQEMDKKLHQRNLIIRNMPIADNEKPLEAVDKMFRERLQLPHIPLQKVTEIGKRNMHSQKQQTNKHTVQIELSSQNDAGIIFKNCHKLKNTGIFIEHELSKLARKRKEKLLVLRKELLRRNAEIKVYVRGSELIVSGNNFYWDEIEGLCRRHEGAQRMSQAIDLGNESEAADCLQRLTGQNLREFLNVLKNYDVQINNL